MITYGTPALIPELKSLWENCYPKDGSYVDFYFQQYFSPDHCCVFIGEDGLESAFYWFDASINVGDENLPMLLLYAGASYPQYRKKGNISSMLSFMDVHCKKEQIYGYVINALETSKYLSERYGMLPNIYMMETHCSPTGNHPGWIWTACSFDEFARLRSKAVDQRLYSIFWDAKNLYYMYHESQKSGLILRTDMGGEEYYAVITRREDSLIIKESNVSCTDAQKLVDSICLYEGFFGQVKLLTREGEVPVVAEPSCTTRVYHAHSYIVIPHEKLLCLKENPCKGVKPYINLTAD